MPSYKLRYRYWYVYADSAVEAKKKAIVEIRKHAESIISVEKADEAKKSSLLKMLLLGK